MADIVQLEEKGTILYPKTHTKAIADLDNVVVKKTGNETIEGMKNFKTGLQINGKSLLDMFYPVGSIFQSVNSVSPATTMGGTWERFGDGRNLVGVSSTDNLLNAANKTGGQVNPLTEHNHTISGSTYRILAANGSGTSNTIARSTDLGQEVKGNLSNLSALEKGDSKNHNNWQPYVTVYRWKRTA